MVVRIFLIIAVVGGLAATGISGWFVRNVILTTLSERDQFHTERDSARTERDETKKKLVATSKELDSTKATLAQTQNDLKTETDKADDLQKQNTDLTANLTRVRGERDTAQQVLEKWNQIGLQPEQVKSLIADLAKTKRERDGVIAENKILLSKRNELQARLDRIVGSDLVPQLPPGLKGQILAVDPKYDFVVLDMGEDKGLVERGELMVNRDGKLIGKIRITSVRKDRSIGNIIPGWKRGEVLEGDRVID